jgi:hypothetical protein
MARMKELSSIIDDLKEFFPGSEVEVDFNSGMYSDVIITIQVRQPEHRHVD